MSLWRIAWNYLWNRKLTTLLTVFSVALGVALISAVLTLEDETKRRFEDESSMFDLVVGPAGSPLQLVLSSVYFMDTPQGLVDYAEYLRLKQEDLVAAAYPVALGDTYKGFRIVGTIPEIFGFKYTSYRNFEKEEREPFQVDSGRIFEKPFEAVIGARVARDTGLAIGDTFESTHGTIPIAAEMGGMSHEEHPYTVVGILAVANSPIDRAIFTSIESIWDLHPPEENPLAEAPGAVVTEETAVALAQQLEVGQPCPVCGSRDHPRPAGAEHEEHDRGVSAVLIKLNTPAERLIFKQHVQEEYKGMPAIPVIVISDFYQQFLGTAQTVLVSVGFLVVIISALSIMIGLYLAIAQRRRDLAIMRALGASAAEIFGAVIIEAFWVTLLGIFCGWVLGAAVSWGIGIYLTNNLGLVIRPFAVPPLLIRALAMVATVGLLAGVLPAAQAYRTDVAKDLAAV
jgi:putative ABC transport system permease protein